MTNRLKEMGETKARRIMVGAAIAAAEGKGFKLKRQPGRGLTAVYDAMKNGEQSVVSIRTTRDRWFAFPTQEHGKKWKTLDKSDQVIVAAVDDPADPQAVDVYLFPADEVRKRFDASYAARIANGQTVKDDYGMWVMLDKGDDANASQVGHSLAVDYPAIARYTLDELEAGSTVEVEGSAEAPDKEERVTPLNTVADVLSFARERIAVLTGMPVDGIKLDLKMGV